MLLTPIETAIIMTAVEGELGKRGFGRRVNEFTKYFKHLGSSILSESELSYDLPPDLFRAIKSVQEWRRTKLEDKQRKLNPLFGKTRNNQLEFNFAA